MGNLWLLNTRPISIVKLVAKPSSSSSEGGTTLLEFLSLTYLNPHPHFFQLKTQPAAVTPRTSLYAQALHVGKDKSEAPTLQETNTGSLGALSDRLPLQRRPAVPVGVQISAPLWVLTG